MRRPNCRPAELSNHTVFPFYCVVRGKNGVVELFYGPVISIDLAVREGGGLCQAQPDALRERGICRSTVRVRVARIIPKGDPR